MRVALIVPSYSTLDGFGVPSIRLLVQELGQSIDLTVFPLRYPRVAGWQRDGSVEIEAIGGDDRRLRSVLWRALRSIQQRHRRMPFDLVHAIWLSESGLAGLLAGKALGIPTVASIGGAELAALPAIEYGGARTRRGRAIHFAVMRGARIVTGGSEYVLDLAERAGTPRSKLTYAPLPVNLDIFSGISRETRKMRSPVIMHAGAYIPVKDHVTLLRSFARVRRQVPGARLHMAGEDPLRRRPALTQLSRELGVSDGIELHPRLSQERLAGLMRDADLFVFPSLHESQGLAPLEAAATGLPIIGTKVGAVRDLAPESAIAVEPGHAISLATAILDLINNPDRRSRLAESGRNQVLDSFSPQRCAERFLDVYRHALVTGDKS